MFSVISSDAQIVSSSARLQTYEVSILKEQIEQQGSEKRVLWNTGFDLLPLATGGTLYHNTL